MAMLGARRWLQMYASVVDQDRKLTNAQKVQKYEGLMW
jgi:hypothetical protein